MRIYGSSLVLGALGSLLLSSCTSTGVNPTGLMGAQAMCPMGPRPTLDCRGVLQQYARDLKADFNVMSKVQVGLGLSTTKLTEADALTSDLLQHSYQTCTLYNACIIPPEEYASRSQQLQSVQFEVRKALVAGGYGYGQQNIQINPPGAGQPFPGQPMPGQPFPGQPMPGQPFPGQPFPGNPQPGGIFPGAFDPNAPQPGFPPTPTQPLPGQVPSGAPTVMANVPNPAGAQVGESILNILRSGSDALRPAKTSPEKKSFKQPTQDLDMTLRGMVQSLRQDIAKKTPNLAGGRVVVGNINEENRPWGSPLGAVIQDRLSSIVVGDRQFKQAFTPTMRGVTVKEVAKVDNPNDPQSLTTIYDTELAIAGTYQPQGENILVKLAAYQGASLVAQTNRTIPKAALPDVLAETPANGNETTQLLDSLNQLGPRATGFINITTNRPGSGSSYRLGEEIIFIVTAKTDGYLYLIHTDAEKNASVIFPNQFQPQATIRSGQTLQVPTAGASFRFEASPPFGLETTAAIITTTPLSNTDLEFVKRGLTGQKQELAKVAGLRGITTTQAGGLTTSPTVRWNTVTVLVRP